jgi:predicted nucleic acid-binding protein
LGIKIIGTPGLISKAKQRGLIGNLLKVIDLLERADFRLSPILKQQLLDS